MAPKYTPIQNPINALSVVAKRSPNAYQHVAVHPLVFSYTEASFVISNLSSAKVMWNTGTAPSSGFSELDFSLLPTLDIWLDSTHLGDLLLDTSNFPSFAGITREEQRWALNVGTNLIQYRPKGRYGRFTIINRANATMTALLSLSGRSL